MQIPLRRLVRNPDVLYLDNRTGSKELYPTLRRLGVQCEVVDLKKESSAADFEFAGNGPDGPVLVGVERKKLGEMLNSAFDTKRWAGQQLIGLMENYHYVVLIVEGGWRAGKNGELEAYKQKGETNKDGVGMGWAMWVRPNRGRRLTLYSELDGLLNSLRLQLNVVVKLTADEWTTCQAVRDLYGWFQKPWNEHKSFRQIYAPVHGPVRLVRPCPTWKVASQIDGVDYELGRRAKEVFKTPKDLVMASEDDWAMIKGISREGAKRIRKWLGHND